MYGFCPDCSTQMTGFGTLHFCPKCEEEGTPEQPNDYYYLLSVEKQTKKEIHLTLHLLFFRPEDARTYLGMDRVGSSGLNLFRVEQLRLEGHTKEVPSSYIAALAKTNKPRHIVPGTRQVTGRMGYHIPVEFVEAL